MPQSTDRIDKSQDRKESLYKSAQTHPLNFIDTTIKGPDSDKKPSRYSLVSSIKSDHPLQQLQELTKLNREFGAPPSELSQIAPTTQTQLLSNKNIDKASAPLENAFQMGVKVVSHPTNEA